MSGKFLMIRTSAGGGMRAASGSPKAALSEPAGQKKQPVSLAAVPPSGAQEGS